MARPVGASVVLMVGLLGGCATGAPSPESTARAECAAYARAQEHSGRMKDACMIAKGYVAVYDTVAGWVEVRAAREPRPTAEAAAADLKGCNDATTGLGYEGRAQFATCMEHRGYAVTAR